jgi:hypothetical protein
MKILGQYKKLDEAVSLALKLVLSYINVACDQKKREELAGTYTPNVLTRAKKRTTSCALVVFDIDDTLIFDHSKRGKPKKNKLVFDLLVRLKEVGAQIHLVTARVKDEQMIKETEAELLAMKIPYDSLHLAPEVSRKNMATVSRWKMMTRRSIGAKALSPIVLTVGDQWGDMVVLPDEDKITLLDETYKTSDSPYIVLRPSDNVSLWGLKLQAFDKV